MTAKYIPIDDFFPVVEFQLTQRVGRTHSQFCLFRIGFDNPQLIGSSFGAQDAMRRLNQFGTALASTVRPSDFVSRDLTVFWVLSPGSNVDLLRDRSHDITRTIDDFGLDIVDCHARGHVFPHPEAAEIAGAIELLERFELLHDPHGFAAVLNRARSEDR